MLTTYAQETLDKRTAKGIELIQLAWHPANVEVDEDFDSAARDAISDILTARFGPAGKLVSGEACKIEHDVDAYKNASALLLAALNSYSGDAEDYIEEEHQPEPGQYGYEEPEPQTEITLRLGDDGWQVVGA